MKDNSRKDRRENQRFVLGNSCIINHENTVGTIIDIGKGGMSCMCLDSNRCERPPVRHVDIFCIKDHILAEKVQVKRLSSEVILGKYVQDIKTRKCRFQFVQLDDDQVSKVESIIFTYAIH